jgi:hypothetical protein
MTEWDRTLTPEDLQERLKDADIALQAYEDHSSPYADDWAALALTLKHAVEGLREAVQDALSERYERSLQARMDAAPVGTHIVAIHSGVHYVKRENGLWRNSRGGDFYMDWTSDTFPDSMFRLQED